MPTNTTTAEKDEESSTETEHGNEEYERQLRHTAIVGGLYGIVSLIGLVWSFWQAEYVQATIWVIGTSIVWKWGIDPLLVDIPTLAGQVDP
jgi:hypothetical protein